jgi:hypothetical protein
VFERLRITFVSAVLYPADPDKAARLTPPCFSISVSDFDQLESLTPPTGSETVRATFDV